MALVALLLLALALIVAAVRGRLGGGLLFRALLYLDMFVCALLLNDPDCTISSRCGLAIRAHNKPAALAALGHGLNFICKDHCERAIRDDLARARAAIGRLSPP